MIGEEENVDMDNVTERNFSKMCEVEKYVEK
jgi:hypothetical protein